MDFDGDDINDFLAMGGVPTEETFTVDDEMNNDKMDYMLKNDWSPYDSINNYFESNMQSAKIVAESVLNKYNTEIYIALSPDSQWGGCQYIVYDDYIGWGASPLAIAGNISAFGIFNSADASVTLHCTYDPVTKQYDMEFIYYIIDFYDYEKLGWVCEQDALGLARTYELFGYCPGTMSWKSCQEHVITLDKK